MIAPRPPADRSAAPPSGLPPGMLRPPDRRARGGSCCAAADFEQIILRRPPAPARRARVAKGTRAQLVCARRMAFAIAKTAAMHNSPLSSSIPDIPDMSQTKLFEPFKLGPITLPNRLVMAPLTRNRAVPPGMVPSPLAVDYYGQRASAGLLITEASQVSQQGQGYQDTPGIYSKEQVAGWRKVTDRVHEQRRAHLHPALACRPHLARLAAAGRRQAGGAVGDPRQGQDVRQRHLHRHLRAARAGAFGNSRDHRGFQARHRECAGGRFRRRRNPRRQRLSARPVRQGRHQQAHRCLWRIDREPRQADAGSVQGGGRGRRRPSAPASAFRR